MSDHIPDPPKMISDTPRMESVAGHARGIVDAAIIAEGMNLERELNAANERIKRLEEEGNQMELVLISFGILSDLRASDSIRARLNWNKAKEAKP